MRSRSLAGGGLAVATMAGGVAALSRLTHRWGATAAEHAATLPGDELVPDPAVVATRAVTIEAPPESVWAWLVQIGQDRGGFYSYDRLERLLGLDIRSAEEIRDDWQHLGVGDRIALVAPGTFDDAGYSMPVVAVDPPRSLVLRQSPPEHPWDGVWSFHLQPAGGGATRLISRSRTRVHEGLRGGADRALDVLTDPVTWFMTRRMLLGIGERAEAVEHRRPGPVGPGSRRRLDHDVARLALLEGPHDRPVVSESDLVELPEPARRWMRHNGVVGAPPVRALRVPMSGRFRTGPGRRWMPMQAWQVDTVEPIARIFRMRVVTGGVIPMYGVDSYVDGRGRMLGKLLGAVTVAEGDGTELDLGELVTWVNDVALLAPSMLLGPHTTWHAVDERHVDVVVADRGNVVSARLAFDRHDRLAEFTTHDRWYAGADPPQRTTWHTPVTSWTTTLDGRPVPGETRAVWELPDGPFTYVEGSFDPIALELDPGPDPAGRGGELSRS